MPIRPEYREFYGPQWRTYRAHLIETSGAKCSECGRPQPIYPARDPNQKKQPRKGRWYLNGTHETHDPLTSEVRIRCPHCHGRHDAKHNYAIRRRNKARRVGQLWLFPDVEYSESPLWEIPRAMAERHQETLF